MVNTCRFSRLQRFKDLLFPFRLVGYEVEVPAPQAPGFQRFCTLFSACFLSPNPGPTAPVGLLRNILLICRDMPHEVNGTLKVFTSGSTVLSGKNARKLISRAQIHNLMSEKSDLHL